MEPFLNIFITDFTLLFCQYTRINHEFVNEKLIEIVKYWHLIGCS